MRVKDIKVLRVAEPAWRQPRDWWHSGPMDVFADHDPTRRPPPGAVTNVIVKVTTDEGIYGLGTVGVGSPVTAAAVENHLAPLVLGEDPFKVEAIWEKLYRSTINLGRKGAMIEAISGVDIALWDILGKATGQPVYNLLGGLCHDQIRVYASQLYATNDIQRLRDEAASYVTAGFTAVKMRFGYGPRHGRAGMRKNYELVHTIREAIGADVELMADAYMGWDVRYAIAMIRMIEEFELTWVEEPLMPDDLDGYARVRASVTTPIAAGEHEFTRWGFRDMIAKGAVDILQPDVNRLGGLTEARKVWVLASAYGLPVVPHAAHAHTAHLVASQPGIPLMEYFPRGAIEANYVLFHELFDGELHAEDGHLVLGQRPGLGVDLNASALAGLTVDEQTWGPA